VKSRINSEGAISRRELGRLLVPAAGAALGSGALSAQASSLSEPTDHSDQDVRIYDVRASGAIGDGKTLDTQAIQRAIDFCHANGGGTVLIPAGTFVVGTLELKSNVTLHVSAAGKLLGSADGKQYHAIHAIPLHGDTTLEDGNWALIFAVNAKNVAIEGTGIIDGQGAQFRSKSGVSAPSGLDGNRRPYHLLFYQCEGLSIRNISFVDSAYHSVRIIHSNKVPPAIHRCTLVRYKEDSVGGPAMLWWNYG
jgi:polygalacturonase